MLLIKKSFHLLKIPLFVALIIVPHTAFSAQFPPNGGLGPQAGVGAPFADDAATQAEFNKILEELEQMPEEKLQELEQQLQAEVKRELEAMTPERRKEFDREMADFWRSQGVDPNQLPSLDDMLGIAPTAGAASVEVPTVGADAAPTQKATIIPLEHTPEEVEAMLEAVLRHLESLRHKMSVYPNAVKKLQAWKEAIDDLVYYLKIMDVPEHHKRLVAKEFEPLMKHLATLQKELASSEPRFMSVTTKKDAVEDPYDILRIEPTATDAQIKEAYDLYMKENDPATLRAKLTAEGFEEAEIEGRVKSAQLNVRTVKEAYEKISNPKIRAQTDRALAAVQEQSQVGQEHAQGALNAIINALSQAIYQKNVLEDIQRFMKKYEPMKLEQRKKMEEAEQKRRKEQEAASKLKPTATAQSYEPYYLPSGPSYQPSSGAYNPGYGPGSYGQSNQPNYGAPSGSESKTPQGGSKSGSGGKSASSDKDKDKDKDDKKDGKPAKSDSKKNVAKDWADTIRDITKELNLLNQDISVYDTQNIDNPLTPKIQNLNKTAADVQAAEKGAKAAAESGAAIAPGAAAIGADVAAPVAPGVVAAGAPDAGVVGVPEAGVAPLVELPAVNQDHMQAIMQFVHDSPRTGKLQKSFKKLAELTEKAAEDKVALPQKDQLLKQLNEHPAYQTLQSVTQLQPYSAVRARPGEAREERFSKAKKLFDAVNAFQEATR